MQAPSPARAARSTVGGGGLYNGSDPSYSGFPAYPFNASSRYFRTRQGGNIAFALVNNEPFNVTSRGQALYYDWFIDNAWAYWFVSQSMSLMANGSDVVMHQVGAAARWRGRAGLLASGRQPHRMQAATTLPRLQAAQTAGSGLPLAPATPSSRRASTCTTSTSCRPPAT